MPEKINSCPICGGSAFKGHIQAKDYTTTGEVFNIEQCATCQFVFTNPRPTETEIGKYYQSKNYISHTDGGNRLIDRVYVMARNYAMSWKLGLLKAHQPTGDILDFGCGTGEFLHYCQSQGWNVQGVEPSINAREIAGRKIGKRVAMEISELKHQQFDVVTLWHVLEHIHQLESALKNILNSLRIEGTLFIAVPNYKSADGQHYQNYWAGYDVPRHLWHFSKQTICTLLERNGLKVIAIKPMKMDSFYVSLLSEGYKNPNGSAFANTIKALGIGLKSNWMASKNGNYSSLVYIAKFS
ncbi:MAG: class I SAM-dependent methyltransferase [Flammeovirgaceae bacterium]